MPNQHSMLPIADRFVPRTKKSASGCIEWQAYRDLKGYGKFGIGPFVYLAHRVAYELFVGPIPEGLCVLHECDNPPCVNPTHLFVGTLGDNTRDMYAKGRGGERGSKGERHPMAKLTEADVREIRRRREAGETFTAIAKDFGISKVMARYIGRRLNWKHVV